MLITASSFASASDVMTAGFLLKLCSDPKMGTICDTYLMASIDGILIADGNQPKPKICTPNKTMGLLMETAKQDMALYPKYHESKATAVIYTSLLTNFPCNK